MNTTIYIIQASLLLIGLFGAYWFLLRKETFFQLNRLVLTLIAFAVVLMPLLPVPSVFPGLAMDLPMIVVPTVQNKIPPQEVTPPPTASSPMVKITPTKAKTSKSIQPASVLLTIYWLGVGIFVLRLLLQFFLLIQLLLKSNWKKDGPFIWVEVTEKIKPFSFFYFIVYNPASLSSEALQQVKSHEQIHSYQWHSLDILLGEIFCVLLWFHPLAWKLAQQIRLNLEYLADQIILENGFEKKSYQYSLLQVALNGKKVGLTNNFNQSLIKKRIIMMNAKQSPDATKWKYFLMLPLLIGLVLFINQAQAQQATNSPKEKAKTSTEVSVGKANAKASSPSHATGISSGKGGTARANGSSTATGISSSSGSGASAEQSSSPEASSIYSGEGDNIYFIVRSDVNKKTLDEMIEGIAEAGIQVKISNLDYNSNGEITRIKIEAESDKGINGNVYSDNNNAPIDGPVGFYILERKGGQHFGTINGDPSNLRLTKGAIKFIKGATGYFKGDFLGE